MNDLTLTSEKSLEEMLNDCSIDAIIAIDSDKKIIAWNAMAEKMYSKNKHAVISKSLFEVIPSMNEDGETLQAINLALKNIKSFVPASKEFYHRRHTENHFVPLRDDGNIIGVMNLVHDVSHRIKAEEALQQLNEELSLKNKELQQRNSELVSLSKVASQDLKEPLRKIYTAAEAIIVNDAKQFSNNGRAHLRRIQSASQKMGLIVDDLLAFATIAENDKAFAPVNLNDVIAAVKKQLQKFIVERNASITANDLPAIYGDYTLLVQLFKSIIHNAIKFQSPGNSPQIAVTAMWHEDDSGKDFAKISFADNGIGFNQDNAENIFNLFTKLHDDERFKGSGSGLAISKKIIALHNGNIEAISKEGNGTVIICYLPVEQFAN